MYEIYPLKIGESTEPEPRIFYLGDCQKKVKLYTYMWILKGERRIILVDTGFVKSEGVRFNPEIQQRPEEEPLRQLNKLGINPKEVTGVILTHGHWDHLSPTINSFIQAQIFIQERELVYITNPPHPWFSKFVFKGVASCLKDEWTPRVHLVKGEEDILPGIRVFWTGGHTPGHQSVIVETNKGKVVLTGDVVMTYRNLKEDIPPGFNSNLEECFLAMRRIRKENGILFPGHDPKVVEEYKELFREEAFPHNIKEERINEAER